MSNLPINNDFEKIKKLLEMLENRTLDREEIRRELKPLLQKQILRLHEMGDSKCEDDLQQFVLVLDNYIWRTTDVIVFDKFEDCLKK